MFANFANVDRAPLVVVDKRILAFSLNDSEV